MHLHQPIFPKLLFVAMAATTLGLGAGAASATTEPPTEPTGTASMDTEATASDAAQFCDAEVAAEAAVASGDPATIGPALEALVAAAPEDIGATVEDVIANAEAGPGDPAFDEAYGAMIEYMQANCGFGELNVAASEYAFGGIPEEVAAGPTIVTLENIGEQVHEIVILRINDDVTLTAEELLALPEEELESMVTFLGETFAVPGSPGHTVLDLTPGRYAALCEIPEGTTTLDELMAFEEAEEGPEGTAPQGSAPIGTASVEGSAPADTHTMGTAAAEGSTSAEGSAAAEGSAVVEEGAPHYTLGMFQEFVVV
jgi:hypothetical protein